MTATVFDAVRRGRADPSGVLWGTAGGRRAPPAPLGRLRLARRADARAELHRDAVQRSLVHWALWKSRLHVFFLKHDFIILQQFTVKTH